MLLTRARFFSMSLLTEKAAAWALAIFRGDSPVGHSYCLFISEMSTDFDHPLQGIDSQLPFSVKGLGQLRITLSTFAFWPLSADGTNLLYKGFFVMDYAKS